VSREQFNVRDPDGQITDRLEWARAYLARAHPAASYSKATITREAILFACDHPGFFARFGAKPPAAAPAAADDVPPGLPPRRRMRGGARL
jgi:hypothetical protein